MDRMTGQLIFSRTLNIASGAARDVFLRENTSCTFNSRAYFRWVTLVNCEFLDSRGNEWEPLLRIWIYATDCY